MKSQQNNDQDVLESYPEKEQVEAFPERRYIKLTRFLTVFTIINLAFVIAYAGLYFYMARHRDVSINHKNWVHLYTIDPERKLLLPSEPVQRNITSMQLMMEKALRQYLEERYASIMDMDEMRRRWGENGYITRLSHSDLHPQLRNETTRFWAETVQKRITRDLHIYSLYPVHGDLWSAYIETFDFPWDENLEKKCDCSDNSPECLECKEKNTIKRSRKKILLRANFVGPKTLKNPLGIMVYAYYPAYVPVPKEGKKKETFWDLPPALRPVL